MEIYLMQHGPNLPKDEDPEEGLSREGEVIVRSVGKALKRMGIVFDAVLSSPKKRSRQTAAIVARETGFAEEKIFETSKVKAMMPPEETIQALSGLSGVQHVLVAGHLPSVAEVASFLLTEGSRAAIQFERGGVCRIDVDVLPTHAGRLRWFLLPDHLRLIAA
jgi:phosphohistidine phosphatase